MNITPDRKEFLGDALWNFLCKHYIWNKSVTLHHKKELISISLTNKFQAIISLRIFGKDKIGKENPSDYIEIFIYEYFQNFGFEALSIYFELRILKIIDKLYIEYKKNPNFYEKTRKEAS